MSSKFSSYIRRDPLLASRHIW